MLNNPSDLIYKDTQLVENFIEHILGFESGGLFIMTNLTTLTDFFGVMDDNDYEQIKSAIKQRYDVDLSNQECYLVGNILEKIRTCSPKFKPDQDFPV